MTSLHTLQPLSPSSAPALALPADAVRKARLERLAESAHYALLRRLAPAIRHDMAGALQPISMVAAMLEKRLQKPDPDLLALSKNVNTVNALAREASLSCMELIDWLSPKSDESTPVHTGIANAIALVTTDLSFKGFTLVNQTQAMDAAVTVRTNVLRGLFMAALLTMTDRHKGPAQVLLGAEACGDNLVLRITLEPAQCDELPDPQPGYRRLDWDDVQALADAESAVLVLSPGRVELRCRFE